MFFTPLPFLGLCYGLLLPSHVALSFRQGPGSLISRRLHSSLPRSLIFSSELRLSTCSHREAWAPAQLVRQACATIFSTTLYLIITPQAVPAKASVLSGQTHLSKCNAKGESSCSLFGVAGRGGQACFTPIGRRMGPSLPLTQLPALPAVG